MERNLSSINHSLHRHSTPYSFISNSGTRADGAAGISAAWGPYSFSSSSWNLASLARLDFPVHSHTQTLTFEQPTQHNSVSCSASSTTLQRTIHFMYVVIVPPVLLTLHIGVLQVCRRGHTVQIPMAERARRALYLGRVSATN